VTMMLAGIGVLVVVGLVLIVIAVRAFRNLD
jgi:hypothetical protein